RLDCGRHGPWSLRRQAMFYLDVASYDCKTELEGIHLVDMRRDKSYARDGSRILAMSYPYVILDRGSEESSPNPAR
ncbi:MAG: hypothetical protein ACE5IM_13950, partial [Nitrospinota bacterium]